jgi:hypothetical protein
MHQMDAVMARTRQPEENRISDPTEYERVPEGFRCSKLNTNTTKIRERT